MIVTYIPEKNCYVDSAGRNVLAKDFGHNFVICVHDWMPTGRIGTTMVSGKFLPATAMECCKCGVFMVVELKKQ